MIKLCLRLTLLYQWLSQLVYLKVNGVEVHFSWLASLSSSVVSLGNGNLVGNERRRQARRTSIPRVLRHASVNMFPTHFLRHFTPSCWFDVICVDVAILRLSPSLEARRSQFADHKSQIADRRSCSWPTYQNCFACDFILTRAKFTIHALRLSLNGLACDCDADHYIYEPMHLAVCHYLVGILLRWAWPTATATTCRGRRRVTGGSGWRPDEVQCQRVLSAICTSRNSHQTVAALQHVNRVYADETTDQIN